MRINTTIGTQKVELVVRHNENSPYYKITVIRNGRTVDTSHQNVTGVAFIIRDVLQEYYTIKLSFKDYNQGIYLFKIVGEDK